MKEYLRGLYLARKTVRVCGDRWDPLDTCPDASCSPPPPSPPRSRGGATGEAVTRALPLLLGLVAGGLLPGAEPAAALASVVLYARPVLDLEGGAGPCLGAYLKAVPAGSVLRRPLATAVPERVLARRRQNLAAQVEVLLGPAAAAEGRRFAQSLPLGLEWEGLSEGPVHEADCADQWLAKDPATPLAPFLHLFMAHRLRAGYEAARSGHEKGLWPILARRYREQLALARKTGPPLLRCVADDLEALPHVYLDGHPLP